MSMMVMPAESWAAESATRTWDLPQAIANATVEQAAMIRTPPRRRMLLTSITLVYLGMTGSVTCDGCPASCSTR